MSEATVTSAEPLLRTLAPALGHLHAGLRAWLDSKRHFPLSTLKRATLEGLATDLKRQAAALDVDRPLLVVMLMGGTGVGKSTLLNAMAGGDIAQASYIRPTTRDPVVYYHESIHADRLDPALRQCRLIAHDRPGLEQKIIVDTPDLDSNDLANREKLLQLLPVADVVLYVGSQEKYHDQLGWQLFLQHRQRRAFAFVLNKWDRCVSGDGVLRPDHDLLHDLHDEGFQDPLLFRTCAQLWVDRDRNNGAAIAPPEGEQFADLLRWLEMGLTRLEIEAIKARGVSQLLRHLQEALGSICPPDLSEAAARTHSVWMGILAEEATASGAILLNTLEPYQRDIEHHFALEGHRRFRGLMAGYLHLFTRVKYVGSTLRKRIPFMPRLGAEPEARAAWDVAAFTRSCSSLAGDRHLDARGRALPNRLLVAADGAGFPVELLAEPTETMARSNWQQRYAQALVEVLQQVEREWTQPGGVRRWLQTLLVILADWIPPLVFLASIGLLVWKFFDPFSRGYQVHLTDLLLPFAILLLVLIFLHILVSLLLPLRWPSIRSEFRRRLELRLREDLESAYGPIPTDTAESLRQERRAIEQFLKEVQEVATWLEQREQAASVAGLYGHG
jgi:energy-coupling factor transporter ATP-binding protein EcfA2